MNKNQVVRTRGKRFRCTVDCGTEFIAPDEHDFDPNWWYAGGPGTIEAICPVCGRHVLAHINNASQ